MQDTLKISGLLYLVFSCLLSVVFFSRAEVHFLLLLIIPIVIAFQSFMVLLICYALSKIIDQIDQKSSSET